MTFEYPWYFILLCLLAGGAYAGALYALGSSPFSRKWRWVLAALRFLAASAIAFLLLAPMTRRTVHERQKPLVVLVEDRSLSVQQSADSAFSLQPLRESLEEDFRVQLDSDAGNPWQTDLSALLDVPRDAAAIVLASDGIHNRGGSPTAKAERMGIPIYTVALGDTTPRRDAALANLRSNRIAFRGSAIPVEVTVTASQLKGHTSRLTVTDASRRPLASAEVAYTDPHFSTTLSLSIPAGEPGLHRFLLSLAPVDGEANTANNSLTFYVDIIDGRRKVAIVGNAPHPDLAALKQAVESDPNYETSVMLAADIIAGKHRDLGQCQLALLHNLPSSALPVPEALKEMPKLYVIGLQTDLARFNALKTGLEIVARVKKGNDLTAIPNSGFSLFHFDASDAEAIAQLPPLNAPFGEARPQEGLQSLFTGRLGSIDSRQPLVAAIAQGGSHTAFIWGEGLWRWRLNDYLEHHSHAHFDRLVGRLVGFVASQDGRERFHVEADRIYAAGQAITLGAQLYNEAYELVNTPEAQLSLAGDSLKADYTFSRQGESYALALGALPEGNYRYSARTTLNGQTFTDEGSFAVEALNLEQARLEADHTLLRTLSAASGGRMVRPDALDDLRQELSHIKPVIHSHTRRTELLALPVALALLLLLLAAEWVLRKYHGAI